MSARSWGPIGGKSFVYLATARLQSHYAVQWLARAARAYIPPEPDDSHTNLGWNDTIKGFVTHALKDDVRLALRLSDLTLLLLGQPKPLSFALNRRTDTQARQWLGEQLTACGLEAAALDAPSPYELPSDPIGSGTAYGTAETEEALAELSNWFGNADISLTAIRGRTDARVLVSSPVRCWPHHFDVATLASLDKSGAEHGRSVNTGFSPGDHHYKEPYFYVSPYPYPETAALKPLPALGHWHTHEFTAAVAPASRIVAAGNPQNEVDIFLGGAINACLNALS